MLPRPLTWGVVPRRAPPRPLALASPRGLRASGDEPCGVRNLRWVPLSRGAEARDSPGGGFRAL